MIDKESENILDKAFDESSSRIQQSFKFKLLNGEFLSNFKAPTTENIYDHKRERAVPLNKYLFTKEIPGFISESKAELIENLENKIQNSISTLKESQETLKENYKAYNELDGSNKIKEINLEMGELIKKSKEDKSFEKNPFPKTEPKFYSSLNKNDLEYYKESLGIEFKEEITKEEQEYLLAERASNKVSNSSYSEKYFKILNNKTKIESNDKFFDNLIQFYFDELKEGICANELDWLNETYIFHEEDYRRRINDTEYDSRRWESPYNRKLGQSSWIEKELANGLTEPSRIEYHEDDYEVYGFREDPYYSASKLNKNLEVLRKNGLEHIFPNHPIYKEHLAKKQIVKKDEYYDEIFDESKNKYFLENGHKYDTKTRELFDILKKLNIKGKNLINIKDFEEFKSLNFTKEEKERFYLNVLSVILISGIEKDTSLKKEFNEAQGFLSDESYDRYYGDILKGKFNGIAEFEKNKDEFIRYATPLSKKLAIHHFNLGDLVSPMTKTEIEQVSNKQRKNDELDIFTHGEINYLATKKVRVRRKFFEDLYVEQKDYDRLDFKIELDDQNYKVETHPIESAANLENKTKYVYDEIKKKYPYIDFLKKDPNQSLSGIWSMKKGDVIFEMKKSDIINLCNSGLNVEEDFEIIVKLLDKGLQNIDYNDEISERKQINKLWKEVYEPWNQIEQDKYNFFETVRKRTKEDVKNSSEIRDFLSNIEIGASKTIDRFYDEYSYEARSSSHFDSRFNTNELIKDIKKIYENVLTENFYVLSEMKNNSIDKRFNPNFEKKDLNEYEYVYDIDTYVKSNDFIESINLDSNNKFNQYMIDYQNSLFEKEIKKLKDYYNVSTAGMQGSIIVDKVLDFFKENIPMSKCTGKSNSNLYFLENSNNLANEMILKYGDDFLTKEKPLYFPTVKNLIEFDVDYFLRKADKDSFIYKNVIKMQEAGMLDGLNSTKRSFKSKSFLKFDDKIDSIKPLESLAAGLTFSKSEELTKVFELELKRSEIVTKHNKLVENIKETTEIKDTMLKECKTLTKTLKKEKIENYTFENQIDKEKFFTVLSTIVDLIKNEENKDKIIDLTKFNNINGNQENEISLDKLYDIFKQYYKLELEKLNKEYDILQSKEILGSNNYKKLELEKQNKKRGMLTIAGSYKEAMLVNYFLSMNDLYRNHNNNNENTFSNFLSKEIIDKNNLEIETIDVLNNFGYAIKNMLDPQGVRQKIEGYDNNLKNNNLNIISGQHFPLFIDTVSDSIWTLEWTTKYPMLHITTLPDIFKLIKDISTMTKEEMLLDMKKNPNERKIKTENFNFSESEVDYIKFLVDSYLVININIEHPKYDFINPEEALKILNNKFSILEKTYTLDDLDRIKDIFSLIQTNYFLQLDQPEENALFLDIDPNFILNPKVNIGAIPFMTESDLSLLKGVHNDDKVKYNNNLPFIDPYNYSIDGKEETLSAFNIQNRKVEGLHSEQSSKQGMKEAKEIKQKFIEKGKLEIFETRELISKSESLYGYNHFNTNNGETLKKSIYRIEPEKLKLFKTKEELDNYIKKYNDVINKDFDDKSLKRF